MSALKDQLMQAMKDAMRARNQARLGVIRMAQAAIKQVEVDERVEVDDTRALAILDKQIKQRLDAAQQFRDGSRPDLAEKEEAEVEILREFMPTPLSEEELQSLIDKAIADTGASSMQDMGKVMGVLRPRIQGRADMGAVSAQIKQRLS